MATEDILALMIEERDKLNAAIQALSSLAVPGKRVKKSVSDPAFAALPLGKRKRKRKLSAAGRKAISEAAKKRWAALKANAPRATKTK